MYSPMSQPSLSPFTSLRNSNAQLSTYSHSRNSSTTKPLSIAPPPAEPHRVPSHKKLSLTYQAAHFNHCKPIRKEENQPKRQILIEGECNGKLLSLQGSANEQEINNIPQQSLMIYFQQKMEDLKHNYLQSLREYEGKVDQLQQQLHRNTMELQHKNAQISKLEATLREMKQHEKHKEEELESQIYLRVQDLQKKLSVIATFAESATIQTQQKTDKLTEEVISCFGSRLSALRQQHIVFMKAALSKLLTLEQRLQIREKQEQSIGTRGSMESVEEAPLSKLEDQGISFWDDCFFYPGEHSENCNLIAEMSSRRSEPLNCWIDHEGYLRYCDSGSFLFNRKGEKMTVGYNELEWLREQGMVRIY